jgi:SAM-dependent methyltransferase
MVDSLSGECSVCGQQSDFVFAEEPRDSGPCQRCGAINRKRQIAYVIRQTYGHLPKDIAVFNTETTGPLHEALKGPHYLCAEYLGDDVTPGSHVKGIRHENLKALSFENDSIDLLLSSDVLEHIQDPYAAHGEIFRVLKPGGRHIFTVPFNNNVDVFRSVIEKGELRHNREPIYHHDPLKAEGILVYTIFGFDMLTKLTQLGFRMSLYNIHSPAHGIVGENAIVFAAHKPPTCIKYSANAN